MSNKGYRKIEIQKAVAINWPFRLFLNAQVTNGIYIPAPVEAAQVFGICGQEI
jgi:hypothetical protein